ncbi:glutamate ABC transporter substrate-binding protein [Nocardioides stalactiti]|uniref:glutamate ABC transporter substrate-binding protein n=1 Tax=Nocardioides stalactiti TaxID=2755356 RepID=UPI0016023015|nr:glutamate ABC transporter substrate-binding protein [Nocardioides stalactiti]
MIGHRRLAVVLSVAVLALGACGYEDTPVPKQAEEPPYTPAPKSECTTDAATLASVPADATPGATVERIRSEGVLKVGVSADTYLMAARNPATSRIQGFDVEVVKAIGEAIFGETFNFNTQTQLRVITAADRLPLLGGLDAEGNEHPVELDLVVRNFTINSCRKEQIDFSAVYYEATQKVLVPLDEEATYTGPSSLAGKRVCAPNSSTSLVNIEKLEPDAIIVPATNHTGCLIKFQNDEVDAITGDDTVLAGLAAQDPYAVVPDQTPLSSEPYGVGIPKGDEEFVAFVNAALEEMVDSGEWQRAYNTWLEDELGEGDPPDAIQ